MINSYPKQKRIEDKAYLEFIRQEPCLACTYAMTICSSSIIDAHHPKHTKYGGNLGWNVKADDRKAMPLCRVHHIKSEGMGEDWFYKKYQIDPKKEAKRLLTKYLETKKGK